MKIQEFHAIYINLEKDKVKNTRIKQILNKLNIKHTRQEAVYGKELSNNGLILCISSKNDEKDVLNPVLG